MKPEFLTLENIGSGVWKLIKLIYLSYQSYIYKFGVINVRVTAIVVITVPSLVAVTVLSIGYESVIGALVMDDSNNWKNNT